MFLREETIKDQFIATSAIFYCAGCNLALISLPVSTSDRETVWFICKKPTDDVGN